MKTRKYSLDSGITIWKIYHYFGMNEFTGKKDYIQRKGIKTKFEARWEFLKITQEYKAEGDNRMNHENI